MIGFFIEVKKEEIKDKLKEAIFEACPLIVRIYYDKDKITISSFYTEEDRAITITEREGEPAYFKAEFLELLLEQISTAIDLLSDRELKTEIDKGIYSFSDGNGLVIEINRQFFEELKDNKFKEDKEKILNFLKKKEGKLNEHRGNNERDQRETKNISKSLSRHLRSK